MYLNHTKQAKKSHHDTTNTTLAFLSVHCSFESPSASLEIIEAGGRDGGASATSTLMSVLRSCVINLILSVAVKLLLVCHDSSERATLLSI